jgi:hypothetical protein
MKKVLRGSNDLEKSNSQLIEKKTQQSIDDKILIQMRKKKDESKALKKLLINLNEPINIKRKQSK